MALVHCIVCGKRFLFLCTFGKVLHVFSIAFGQGTQDLFGNKSGVPFSSGFSEERICEETFRLLGHALIFLERRKA